MKITTQHCKDAIVSMNDKLDIKKIKRLSKKKIDGGYVREFSLGNGETCQVIAKEGELLSVLFKRD